MDTPEGQLLANRYLIEKELGRGGMAMIYTATDTLLKRNVAIKMLYPHLISDSSLMQRFINEAEIIARLNYKSIVSLYDIAEHNGIPFLVLEYIYGYDLRRLYEKLYDNERKPSLEIALIIIYIVSDAVAHAHATGIVHRDIKPENVLISDQGEMKITDFGLAHILADTSITVSGTAIGSPEFMSPEHINSGNIGTSSDVFSLGSLFYWLVSGKSPFYADNTMSILTKISKNDYEPLNKAVAGVDEWISEIVDTCLKHDPELRYKNASELCGAIHSGVSKFTPDPYNAFKTYIASPEQTSYELIKKHNEIRYKDAVSYIKSNKFEKALSLISIMLETGDNQTDAIGLMKKLKYGRYKRWAFVIAEFIFIIVIAAIIIKETYKEVPLNFFTGKTQQKKSVKSVQNNSRTAAIKTAIKKSAEHAAGIKQLGKSSRSKAKKRVKPLKTAVLIRGGKTKNNHAANTGRVLKGDLKLFTYPWAMVFIDGKYIGETPKFKIISLSAGRHKLYIMNPYMKPYSEIIEIKASQTFTKRIDLNRK